MLGGNETKYWQEEYAKGNLDDTDMCGETRALLDGTADEVFWWALKCVVIIFSTLIIYLVTFT